MPILDHIYEDLKDDYEKAIRDLNTLQEAAETYLNIMSDKYWTDDDERFMDALTEFDIAYHRSKAVPT